LARVWGCPPEIISPPFLARKGVRGMVERVLKQPATMTRWLSVLLDFNEKELREKEKEGWNNGTAESN